MKVIHWSPAENEESILSEGIKVFDIWTSSSILSPHHELNCWWLDFQFRKQSCKGFLFELTPEDFPLVHGHWVIDSHRPDDGEPGKRRFTCAEIALQNPDSVFQNMEALKRAYFETFVWRIGEQVSKDLSQSEGYFQIGLDHLRTDRKAWRRWVEDPHLLRYTFEDYQVLISRHISPDRIERVLEPDEAFPYRDLLDEIAGMAEMDWPSEPH